MQNIQRRIEDSIREMLPPSALMVNIGAGLEEFHLYDITCLFSVLTGEAGRMVWPSAP